MIIGLTGGIGSGKSAIARQIAGQGYPVFDTDTEAKRLIAEDPELRKKMKALLGNDIYDGAVYRRDIAAKRIFADNSLREKVNKVVHPAVARAVMQRTDNVLFVECAILFESGFDKLCDTIVVVTAPTEVRISRVMQRDNVSEEQVRARMKTQMSDEERCKAAGFVICNDGKQTLLALTQELLRKLNLPTNK